MKIKIFLITILMFPLLSLVGFAQLDFDNFDIGPRITINSFELIWSTDAYTPYEYQGRALASQGSEVTVEAIVSAVNGNPDSLKYSWFLDNIFQRTKSGYGENSFHFYVLQYSGAHHIIKLQIFNEDRSVFEEKTIKIPVVEPEVIVYPSNGNGHFSDQSSKTSFVLAEKEFSFIAKPFFFSVKELTGLSFEWRFPGQEPIISSDYDANVLALTISGKEGFEEVLENNFRISVTNKADPRQKVSQRIKIQIY